MLERLTPEQQFELLQYAAIEPFGEVRADLRMARALQFYYDSKRGKKGKAIRLGALTLYPDFAEAAVNQSNTEDLQDALQRFASRNSDG